MFKLISINNSMMKQECDPMKTEAYRLPFVPSTTSNIKNAAL